MKKIIIAIFVLSVAACGGNSDKKASTDSVSNAATAENPEAIDENGPALTFTENMFDFGTSNSTISVIVTSSSRLMDGIV